MTSQELLEKIPEFQEYINTLLRKSQNTQDQYLRDITQFCNILGVESLSGLENIRSKDMNTFLAYTKAHKWSNNTVNLRMVPVKLFYKFLNEQEYISNKVVAKFEKLPNDTKETRALTELECNEILQYISDYAKSNRNYVLFLFLLDSGLRKFEYTKLKLSDINGNKIYVEGKRGKKCDIILTQNTMELLQDYIETDRAITLRQYNKKSDYVFLSGTGEQMDRTSFLTSIKKYAKDVGIKDWEKVTVHGVRHSGISIFYKHTKDIKATAKKARHSDPSLTAKIYVHQDEAEYIKQLEEATFKPTGAYNE